MAQIDPITGLPSSNNPIQSTSTSSPSSPSYSAISSSSMQPTTPVIVPPVQPVPTSTYTAPINSIASDLSLATQNAKDAQAYQDSLNAQSKSMADIIGLSQTGNVKDISGTYNAQGVNTLYNQLQDLNAQAIGLKNEASAIPIENAIKYRGNAGVQSGVETVNRDLLAQNALKSLSLGQQYAIAEGNYNKAKNYADQLIETKYAGEEARIKGLKTQQAAFDKYTLTPAEQKRLEATKKATDLEATQLAEKKANELNNNNLSQGWAKSAMESNQPQLASQISSLDVTSPTFKQDLATLQAKINPNGSLDSQYKKMQIEEIAQKINAAKSANNLYGAVSPVPKLSDGTYDTATQNAILSKMSPGDAAIVKAVGNYDMDISKITSLAGGQREALAAKVALVYPGFDMTSYAAKAAYKKNLANTTQGSAGGAINSANKVISHLTSYINNVDKLGNTNAGGFIGTGLNVFKNTLDPVLSGKFSTNLAEANTNATGVKDELAKFFKGAGVADVKSIEDWGKTVSVNAPMSQQIGSVQGAIDLLQGQLVPMIDQYKQTMGQEPPEGMFLKGDTKQKLSSLKNQGFKIDIPGVNYTDPKAYVKYDPMGADNLKAVVKAYPNLSQEDALQLAQSLNQ